MNGGDVVHGRFEETQPEVALSVQAIADAMNARDTERLFALHLWGSKFSKFSASGPQERLDAETTRRVEREEVSRPTAISFQPSDLKVDVFGPVAITTFTLDYGQTMPDGRQTSSRQRSTLVLVNDAGTWKVVHEHFSPFTGGA